MHTSLLNGGSHRSDHTSESAVNIKETANVSRVYGEGIASWRGECEVEEKKEWMNLQL